MNEGIIKFHCIFTESDPPAQSDIIEINKIRSKLVELNLIGTTDDCISYGNISIRYGKSGKFIITGTQTGSKNILTNRDYSIVTDYDIESNKLICTGKIKASSESLTHAAVYNIRNDINSVIHIHNTAMWKAMLNKKPTTSPVFEYGTSELAQAVGQMCNKTNENLIILSGHTDGIIAYGKNSEAVFVTILNNLINF
jgi:ribulose-5-phosphate 4-epimerase/fuculose-1-phosphate aldolase